MRITVTIDISESDYDVHRKTSVVIPTETQDDFRDMRTVGALLANTIRGITDNAKYYEGDIYEGLADQVYVHGVNGQAMVAAVGWIGAAIENIDYETVTPVKILESALAKARELEAAEAKT